MQLANKVALVTGGASGLGLATAQRFAAAGATVIIVDLPTSNGAAIAREGGLRMHFAAADVADETQMTAAMQLAKNIGPLRVVVNCAGRGGALRILDNHNMPGALDHFEAIIRVNLIGSFNVLRLAAAAMAQSDLMDEERGVIVLTASIAAYEGQIGQIPYASAKAGIVGMTLVAARDLASRAIRVCTIAPGVFDTPILARIPPEIKDKLGQSVPHPARLGRAVEFARLAEHIVENPMLNGETIRLDGALRMAPR